MSDAPVPVAGSKRRLKQRFAAAARWLHIYTSVLGLGAVLFFSITGFTLNHPDWMFGSVQRQREFHGQLPVEWVHTPGNEAVEQLKIAEHLRLEHSLHGHVDEFLIQDSDCTVAFKGPGYSADAFIDRATGKYDVTESSEGLIAVLNDFHKGRHTGNAWSLVIDIVAILLVIISATGLALLFFIKRRRLGGSIIAIIGTIILLLVAWLLVA
jgi:hypothetical protein